MRVSVDKMEEENACQKQLLKRLHLQVIWLLPCKAWQGEGVIV